MKPIFFIRNIFLIFAFASCAALLEPRTFADKMSDGEEEGIFVPGKDFPVANGDTGKQYLSKDEIRSRTPASAYQAGLENERNSVSEELAELEGSMTPEEFERYEKIKGQFPSNSDRVYYLRLSPSEKYNYLNTLGIRSQADSPVRSTYGALSYLRSYQRTSRELFLGMDKDQVVDRWGRPDRVEIAGNPREGNERWTFQDNGGSKRIYFERGKVQGWVQE